jgi:hypothetical protein
VIDETREYGSQLVEQPQERGLAGVIRTNDRSKVRIIIVRELS